MNYPDGMTTRDWDHVEGVGMREPLETRVLRAVVYLTYVPGPEEERAEDDEGIEAEQSPFDAERDIRRALNHGGPRGLTYLADKVEVVDAQYMSELEADLI